MTAHDHGNRELGLLWGGVALTLVALSPVAPQLARVLPVCLAKSLLGLPCPSCGTTRSALALAHFDLVGALAISPLATIAWIGLVGGGLVAGIAALLGHGLPRRPLRLSWPVRIGLAGAILLNWLYLILTGA